VTALTTIMVPPSPRISVDWMGEGDLVLFLHGIGGNKRNWRGNLPAFARHFRAAAWDARGYGESEDYDGDLLFRSFAEDVARVMDFLKAPKAHIVGLSMGGRIAMDFARAFPERLATLTLCATHIGFAHFSERAKAEFIRSRKEPLVNGGEPADIAEPVARSLVGPKCTPEALAQLVDSMSRLHKWSYIKAIEASVLSDTYTPLDHIHVPTHVMCGADDPLTSAELAREIQGMIEGAELTIIPEAGHLLNIERPAEFEAASLGFLLRHRNTT
jgi:3-oxoadipate enol-lactonase